MNTTLLKKELTGLRFCILLIVAVAGIDWLTTLVTDFPDRSFDAFINEGAEWLFNWLLVGLFIGATVFNQEREHQTQGFLDGLAVSRLSLFLHKTLAALLVASLFVLLEFIWALLLSGLSATSISGPIQWKLRLAECGLALLLGVTVVAVGMLLSFTRKWFPLVAGLLVVALLLMTSSSQSWVTWIDFNTLVVPTLGDGGALIIPWKQVAGFSLFAGVALLLACILFRWRDGIISRWFARDFAAWEKVMLGLILAGVWGTAVAIVGKHGKAAAEDNPVANLAGDLKATKSDAGIAGFASHETEHYDILFRESQREEVMKLAPQMDPIYQQVADYFQNPSLPGGRIVLDVASSVDSHAAGVTNWTKIRVPMTKAKGEQDFMKTLRHETAHVFIEQISDGKASADFNAMRAFHEGVATAVELSVDDEYTTAARLKMERWAALADSRGQVPLATLYDNQTLTENLHHSLAYPLGYVLAKSLVDIGGPSLPRRFLETLKNSPPPANSSPSELWRHVLHECGVSLETLIPAYKERLALLQTREESYVAGFPRLSANVTEEGEEIVIRLNDFSGQAEGASPVCLVTKAMGLTDNEAVIRRSADGSFRLKRSPHAGTRLTYFLGWHSKEMVNPVFEPKAEAVLK